MHEHDLDLIADYAGGSSDEPSRAQALIDSCSTCAAEFETQQLLQRMVSSIDVTPMNDLERARLRRQVAEAAGLAPAPRRRTEHWWERRGLQLASAAAIVFVGVGLVGVLGQLRSEQAASDSIAIEDAATVAQAPLESADRVLSPDASQTQEAGAAEMASDDFFAAEPPAAVVELGELDADALTRAVDETIQTLGGDGDDVADDSVAAAGGDTASDGLTEEAEECELPESAVRLAAVVDGRRVVVAVGIDDPQVKAVAVWADTCEPFDLR